MQYLLKTDQPLVEVKPLHYGIPRPLIVLNSLPRSFGEKQKRCGATASITGAKSSRRCRGRCSFHHMHSKNDEMMSCWSSAQLTAQWLPKKIEQYIEMQLGRCLNWQGRFLANSTSPNDISLALRSFRLCSAGKRKENFWKPGQWSFAKKTQYVELAAFDHSEALFFIVELNQVMHVLGREAFIFEEIDAASPWYGLWTSSTIQRKVGQCSSLAEAPTLATSCIYLPYHITVYMWHVQTHRYVMVFSIVTFPAQVSTFFPLVSLPLLIQPLSQLKDQVGWAAAQAP